MQQDSKCRDAIIAQEECRAHCCDSDSAALTHSVCLLQVSSLDQSDLRKFGEDLVAQLLIGTTQCSLMSPFLSKIKVPGRV